MQDNIIVFPEPPPGDKARLVMPDLPILLTSLIGREQEVHALHALLLRPDVRLLTLTGTAGVGKTRLALEVAGELVSDFADSVHLVSLAPLSDPAFVLPAIARRLGLIEGGPEPLLDRLKASQRDKQRLLLLDNFEQVISAAPLLAELLEACPHLKLMVTSREVLRLRGEHQFAILPLALPDPKRLPEEQSLAHVPAVHLFLQRAQAIRADFQLTTDNAAAIAEVCLRLDGLPLAIELAAARTKLLAPQALLARLDRRLQVLTGGARDLPLRQKTLRNALAWSYELLADEEQRLFRRLAIFAGGATLEALEAIFASMGDETGKVFEGVASLLDKSLIQPHAPGDDEPRVMMLETIREYGLELLASGGEAQATREAHAAYYLALAEQAAPELSGPRQLIWLERLEREHDNLRAALSWFLEQSSDGQSGELALRLSGALSQFWYIRGYASEGRHWLERALEISRGENPAVRAKALVGAGDLAILNEDFSQAEAPCEQCLALCRELGDCQGSATALSSLGYAALMRNNFAEAHKRLEEALALFREVGDIGGCAYALNPLANVLFFEGEHARALALLEESLALSKVAGNARDSATALVLLGLVLLFQGDLAQAHARLEESLAISREAGYKRNIGISIFYLGLEALLQGDMVKARSLLEESLVHLKEVGERGRIAEVFFSLGIIWFRQGDHAAARGLMEESLKICLELNHRWDTAGDLEGLAAVATAQGEPVRAVWFMSVAQALREAIGTPLPSVLQALHEFTIASVRTQLGELAFAAAWAEGRIMTPEQALAAQEPVTMPTEVLVEPSTVPPVPKIQTSPDGLTTREVDVLRLVAQGMTNEQVAEQLVISPRTVNTHLTSIFSKIGVSTRSAATRYAIDHHLV